MKRALACVIQDAGDELEVCVSDADELPTLSADISRLQPGVLFLRESMPMAANYAVTALLAAHASLRVIIVSEQTNWLQIFSREQSLESVARPEQIPADVSGIGSASVEEDRLSKKGVSMLLSGIPEFINIIHAI